jgi:hypothetical protein
LAVVLHGAAANAETVDAVHCQWQQHTVQQYRDGLPVKSMPAESQIPTLELNPSGMWHQQLVFMPEKDRLLLSSGGISLYSDDLGATWNTVPFGFGDSLTYLGAGKLLGRTGTEICQSTDYGQTWQTIAPVPRLDAKGRPFHTLGPMLVDKDTESNKVTRLTEAGFDEGPDFSDGYLRYSRDVGLTWSEAVEMPWTSETTLLRAGNGDIIAATRTNGKAFIPTPTPPHDGNRWGEQYDYFGGLGIHISQDDGRTWSPLNKLFDYGRHHPSLVLLPNNDLLLTYVVRLGYEDLPDGLPQYGIEAVVSRDNGKTWDLKNRYVIDKWKGVWRAKPELQLMAPATTATVALPDGNLITSFNTGTTAGQRHLKLVRWRLDGQAINARDE